MNYVLTLFAGVLMGLAGIAIYSNATQPYCPQEDSCIANYDGKHDRWEIVEIAP
jgi:hypothetical protein